MERKATRPRLRRTVPTIADPQLRSRLEAAAKAAGCESVDELADVIADSGALALPPSEGRSRTYTIEQLGMRLWGEISKVLPRHRPEWFAALADKQKAAVIVVMRDRGIRTEVIARDLELDPVEVSRVWNSYSDRIGELVVGLRLNTIAGQMQLAAERAQEMAVENDDAGTFWRIEKDKIATLQNLGIIDRAIHRIEHTHKFDEQQRAEIEELVKLEQKKRVRTEELRTITAEVFDGDPLPQLAEGYDD